MQQLLTNIIDDILTSFIYDGILLRSKGTAITFGIFFYSTFFTSVWVWLYAGSIALIRLGAHSAPVLRVLQFALPIRTKPLRAIGTVAFIPCILVSGIVWLIA